VAPLVAICGFLGAGKTTFLRQILPLLTARGVRPRVVINDYQNARIDAALLREVASVVEPVNGSCICCGSREELVGALAGLPAAPGDVVIVEVNGTTDTEAMLEILTAAPELSHLSPPVQLTVVDAERFGAHDWRNDLERVQIRTATHLYLSKSALVPAERLAAVEAAAWALSPRAAAADPAGFAEHLAALTVELAAVPTRVELGTPPPRAPARAPSPAHEAHHFASIELPLPGRADPAAFARFLDELPPEILRAKGIVDLGPPVDAKRSFQKTEARAEISDCALFEPETLPCSAIFVGVRLPLDAIRAGLRRVLPGPGA
jgi:G3E family GTPase